jgi:hypothetical protein
MSASPEAFVAETGVPFDVFIQSLTEQLDKAQAAMALKARVAKLPLTFAVKEVSFDLRAFLQLSNDDVYVRPAGPGDTEASTIKLALTTITRSMIEENAVDFSAEKPQFSLSEALKGHLTEEDQRGLERIGVRTVQQLTELRKTAGTDVVARLARMPVNRLQQALLAAAVPRVTRVERAPSEDDPDQARIHLIAPGLLPGRLPLVRAAGYEMPVIESRDERLVLASRASQLGFDAEIDFGDGRRAKVPLREGATGNWSAPTNGGSP